MTIAYVPRLNLAPKLRRPLSLRNPLDYLRLTCWAFFFPQAIRWYIERFGRSGLRRGDGLAQAWTALRENPVWQNLALQALLCVLMGTGSVILCLGVIEISVHLLGATCGMLYFARV
jgi:membrane associated rhomboid family serine protease